MRLRSMLLQQQILDFVNRRGIKHGLKKGFPRGLQFTKVDTHSARVNANWHSIGPDMFRLHCNFWLFIRPLIQSICCTSKIMIGTKLRQ